MSFVIPGISLYRGLRYTGDFVIPGTSLYRGLRYTGDFVIPGLVSWFHCSYNFWKRVEAILLLWKARGHINFIKYGWEIVDRQTQSAIKIAGLISGHPVVTSNLTNCTSMLTILLFIPPPPKKNTTPVSLFRIFSSSLVMYLVPCGHIKSGNKGSEILLFLV